MNPDPNIPTHNRGLHRLSILTAVTTFPLVFMGGLVTSHDVGLSVPDWPNSYGYNMFLFPPSQWVGGIWYEHVHRLMGTVVGFCSILLVLRAWGPARRESTRRKVGIAALVSLVLAVLCAAAPFTYNNNQALTASFRHAAVGFLSLFLVLGSAYFARHRDDRRRVRWLSVAVLAAVIFQGVLGGLRVVLLKLDLAIVHACFAQAFFCLAILMCAVTSRWWEIAATQPDADAPDGRKLIRLATISWLIIFAQLIVGATMRHHKAGLAIPDLPLAYGKALPPITQQGLATINAARSADWQDPVTMSQVWLAFGHRLGAIIVTIAIIALALRVLRRHAVRGMQWPAWLLLALLAAQLTLGVLTVLLKKPADIASAHVAVGALVLATTFLIAARAMRLYARAPRILSAESRRGFEMVQRPEAVPA